MCWRKFTVKNKRAIVSDPNTNGKLKREEQPVSLTVGSDAA